jgi:hypothetical protein
MSASWIIPLVVMLAFGVLLLLPVAEVLLSPVRRVRFACAWAKQEVSVGLVRRTAFGIIEPADVCSCSAFQDPKKLTCDKVCLRVLGRE